MGQPPYWTRPEGPPSPPPPPPPEKGRSTGVRIAIALLAVALIGVSALAFVGLRRTQDLERRLSEQRTEREEEPENPLEDLLDGFGEDLGDSGDLGDLFGGANTDLLECLGDGGSGGLGDLFGGDSGGLGDLFGGGGSENQENPARVVKKISKQVEKIRNLRFEQSVDAEFLRPRQLRKRIAELFLEDYSKKDAELEARMLEALGAIDRDSDLFTMRREALEGQVAGFYVPDTEELVVLATEEIGALEKTTLAHELEHALADQRLGLPLPKSPSPETADRDLSSLAVIEGDATLTMQRWSLRHLSFGDQLSMLGGSPQLQESQEQLEQMPHFLRQELSFPYLDGLGFVCELYKNGDWAAIDEAYEVPPASTDQILFPERFDPGAEPLDPRDVGDPGGRWTSELEGSFGAAQLKWLFEAPGGDTGAALDDPLEAVAAWGGGEVELFTDGDATGLGVALVQRPGSSGLCEAVTEWYSASFGDDEETPRPGRFEADGGIQDALIACSGDEVRVGIAPDLATAQSLVR